MPVCCPLPNTPIRLVRLRLGRLRSLSSSSSRAHALPSHLRHSFSPRRHISILLTSLSCSTGTSSHGLSLQPHQNTPFRRSPGPLPHSFAYVHSPLPLPTFHAISTSLCAISPLLPLHIYPRVVVPPPLQSLILGKLSKHGASAAARIARLPS